MYIVCRRLKHLRPVPLVLLSLLKNKRHRIMPIVEEYAVKSDSLRKKTYSDFHSLMDEFHSQLKPFLTDEQMQRLHEFPKYVAKKYKRH